MSFEYLVMGMPASRFRCALGQKLPEPPKPLPKLELAPEPIQTTSMAHKDFRETHLPQMPLRGPTHATGEYHSSAAYARSGEHDFFKERDHWEGRCGG